MMFSKTRRVLALLACLVSAAINYTEAHAKKALIYGITGQDGSYLAELLLSKGYEVHGVIRRASVSNTERLDHIFKTKDVSLFLHFGDLTDTGNVMSTIAKIQPDEIYNLAAQSHVKVSFDEPEHTGDVDGLGALRILDSIRILGLVNKTRYYQASTSEMFGLVQEIPQKETTPLYPRSPYGVAKVYAHWITINYRESYGIFACSGILFNHESPRRGELFVTRKITRAAAARALGDDSVLALGNIDSYRDWGYAADYVEAMWLMLQQEKPEDFVIATGKTYTVRDFVERAYAEIGITIEWRGKGLEEVGVNKETGETIVCIDADFFRPAEVEQLLGDASKAERLLGWKPKTDLAELARLMVRSDIEDLKKKS